MKTKHKRAKQITHDRRLEIQKLIENLGLWNINQTQLAKEFKVTRQMIAKDIHKIMQGMPKEDLKVVKFNIKTASTKALRELQKVLATANAPKDKISAATGMLKACKTYIEMLESFGDKEKVADKVAHEGNVKIIAPDWWYKQNEGPRDNNKKLRAVSKTKKVPRK